MEASVRSRTSIPLRVAALSLTVVAALQAAGCWSAPRVSFEHSDASYTVTQAEQFGRSVSLAGASSIKTEQATAERQKALAELRRLGSEPAAVADMLTKDFPQQSRAVPVSVTAATVSGVPAYVVVEATGRPGGTLTSRRVWVFDASSGAVMGSASYN
jgi:hypothetical protein